MRRTFWGLVALVGLAVALIALRPDHTLEEASAAGQPVADSIARVAAGTGRCPASLESLGLVPPATAFGTFAYVADSVQSRCSLEVGRYEDGNLVYWE